MNIRAGGKADVRFRHVFDHVGDNLGAVNVAADDSDRSDNVYYFNAHVTPQIAVVVINGHPDANPQPGRRHVSASGAHARIAFCRPGDLPPTRQSRRTSVMRQVVVLADVGRLPAEVRQALVALLARGGGVLFAPGDRVNPEGFNRDFAETAPCQLRRQITPAPVAGRATETSLVKMDLDHPALAVFGAPHHGDLSLPRFQRYWEVELPRPWRCAKHAGVGPLCRRRAPGNIERRIGQGLSILIVAPLSLAWSDLPLRSTFLPLVHEILLHLAVRTDRATAFTIGDRVSLPTGHTLRDPRGAALTGDTLTLEESGFYTELDPSGATDRLLAVNRQLTEADPTPIAPEKIQAAVETAADQVSAVGDDTSGRRPVNKEGRPIFLVVHVDGDGRIADRRIMGGK